MDVTPHIEIIIFTINLDKKLNAGYNIFICIDPLTSSCRRYSNYILILNLTPGFNGLAKGNCKTRQQYLKFLDFLGLILEILR